MKIKTELKTIIFNGMDHLKINKLTNTEKRVLRVIKEYMGLLALEVKLSSTLKDDLGCGSIQIIEALMKVENEFNIELSDDLFKDDYWQLTVADVVKMVDGVINEINN